MLKKRNVQVYNTVLVTIATLDPHNLFILFDHLYQFPPPQPHHATRCLWKSPICSLSL